MDARTRRRIMNILAVNELTTYIAELFDSDPVLQDIWIRGEVSNCSRPASGHCYFTLKDGASQVRAVLFKQDAIWQPFAPSNGLSILAHGRVILYEPRGEYQLRVDLVQPDGVGALQLAFEELRTRLDREGLFDPARKRPLPQLPRTIGVVTSATGAVWHDIQNIVTRRFPLAELVLAPTRVQGDEAPDNIAAALRAICADDRVEVVILARGGGSAEDLAAFNDERVARAIFAARVPVISGVGHEVDITIADFVADLRAPTPSAAAELVAPDIRELLGAVEAARDRLRDLVEDQLSNAHERLARARVRLAHASPQHTIARGRDRIGTLRHRAGQTLRHNWELSKQRIDGLERQLLALDPRAVLARGYAVVEDTADGLPLTHAADAYPGQSLHVTVADGAFEAEVSAQYDRRTAHYAAQRRQG
jgi:exodeoxyribonuclease VII large subunit